STSATFAARRTPNVRSRSPRPAPTTCFWSARRVAARPCSRDASRRSSRRSRATRSEEHTSELQSRSDLVCRLLLEKKKTLYVQRVRQMARGDDPSPEPQARRLQPTREASTETSIEDSSQEIASTHQRRPVHEEENM